MQSSHFVTQNVVKTESTVELNIKMFTASSKTFSSETGLFVVLP